MRFFTHGLAVLLAFFSTLAGANEAEIAKIKQMLESSFPGLEISAVDPSPINGIYEVSANAGVVYVSADGHYALNGSLLDLQQGGLDLTEKKRGQSRLASLNNLDKSTMIVFKPENPKHVITVFTDVDCGYCRKFHREVAELNSRGVEVRYLAFPRAGIGSSSYKTMVSIWCADNQQAAMTNAKSGQPVEHKTCEHPVDQHLELVSQFGLRGTPTIVHEDGSMTPGYLPVPQLMQRIESLK